MENKKTIAWGMLCDCGCKAPMMKTEVEEDEKGKETKREVYALFESEKDARRIAIDYGIKGIGRFEISLIETSIL